MPVSSNCAPRLLCAERPSATRCCIEPLYLTAQGSSRLLGVLLDGFPVYGTRDAGGVIPSGLDTCNGHVGTTPEFSGGIYHYHIVAEPPYIAGCFRGQPGTAS